MLCEVMNRASAEEGNAKMSWTTIVWAHTANATYCLYFMINCAKYERTCLERTIVTLSLTWKNLLCHPHIDGATILKVCHL
jgi:hypothetical protein